MFNFEGALRFKCVRKVRKAAPNLQQTVVEEQLTFLAFVLHLRVVSSLLCSGTSSPPKCFLYISENFASADWTCRHVIQSQASWAQHQHTGCTDCQLGGCIHCVARGLEVTHAKCILHNDNFNTKNPVVWLLFQGAVHCHSPETKSFDARPLDHHVFTHNSLIAWYHTDSWASFCFKNFLTYLGNLAKETCV